MTGLDLQSRKFWLGSGAVVALLIVLAAWFLAVSPQRTDAADLRSQTADTQLQNAQLEGQNAVLTRESQHLGAYRTKLAKALAALPSQAQLSAFTKSLTADAHRAGVKLSSINVGAPSAVAPTTATVPTPEATSSASDSASSDQTTEPAAAPSTTAAGPLSTTFTLQVSGSMAHELAFLSAVRTGARSGLITSTQFADGGEGGSVSLTAQVQVFSSPIPAAQLKQLRQLVQPAK